MPGRINKLAIRRQKLKILEVTNSRPIRVSAVAAGSFHGSSMRVVMVTVEMTPCDDGDWTTVSW